jgi:hypothetical protein
MIPKLNRKTMNSFAIFVNTCDKFEDCWLPFFKLFKVFWPDYEGKIYLNTDYKEFRYTGLNIISIKNAEGKQDADNITWSECLRRGLNAVDSDVVLYLQEDYFLKGQVQDSLIQKYADLIKYNQVDCIHLTDQNTEGPIINNSPYPGLSTIGYNASYRVSCQAALWNKNTLLDYIRPYESAWNFEEFGTKRSKIKKDQFLTVDRNIVKLNENELIPYVFTGIIQGRWFEEVIPLFSKYEISVDYSIRGFVNARAPKPFWRKVEYQLLKIPVTIRSYFELLFLMKS